MRIPLGVVAAQRAGTTRPGGRVGVLVVALLAAGCVAPPAGTMEPGPCGEDRQPARDAPALAAFRESPLEMARRLGEVVGDPVVDDEPEMSDGDRWTRWKTRAGTVTLERERESEGVFLLWDSHATGALPSTEETRATVERVLAAFGAQANRFEFHEDDGGFGHRVTAHSRYREDHVANERAEWQVGYSRTLTLTTLHATPAEGATMVADAEASRAAREYAACLHPGVAIVREGGPSWAVANDTLLRVVPLQLEEKGEPSHCGHQLPVRIVAATGKPTGVAPFYCD